MKRKQSQWRMEMYALMATDDDWYKNEQSELFQKITELGQYITHNTEDYKPRPFEPEKYKELINQGLMQREIAEYFKLSLNRLRQLREENDLP